MSQSWARALACCASQQLGKTNEAAIALRVIVAGAVCVCARARAQARQPQKKICQNTEKRPIAATPRASTYRCLQHARDSRVLAGSDTIIGLAVTLRERSRAAPAQRAQGPRPRQVPHPPRPPAGRESEPHAHDMGARLPHAVRYAAHTSSVAGVHARARGKRPVLSLLAS